ncbi:Cysteine-rich secretory protein family protein [Prosthecobacter debontii]|uniref:Cysteine-rich secretory protein family protein n=1 Tax=Prosthecobacter debontii TaxID=48467 RepID=A0A1T4WSZ6_9BACT|nr:putative Ig domain-containing protein [Prosthecobacter debontii]SKA79731.1 Cysteine-rich secretory protein family protein [Prosthecobacter debontii]
MKKAAAMLCLAWAFAIPVGAQSTTLYSIGVPTDDEQLYLELINRARANPAAEGEWLATSTDPAVKGGIDSFEVDVDMMQDEFDAIAARPPLAMNANLINSARLHSQDMLVRAEQTHFSANGDDVGDRALDAGYNFSTLGENVFAFAASVLNGHAGFQVDWGAGPGGMQSGRGHRVNIHDEDFREVGIGIVLGSKKNTVSGLTVGPQLVTQNFGARNTNQAFVTGVAYYDINGNDFYDPGEGIGGITVNVSGSSFHAVTSTSGGYAVPVPTANANRTASFSGLGMNSSGPAAIANQANVKVDFTPVYIEPSPTGPATTAAGASTTYTFPQTGGATGYQWQAVLPTPATNDSADSLSRMNAVTTAGYTPRSTTVKHSGSAAYRLTHLGVSAVTLTYKEPFIVQPGAQLAFRSRLRTASVYQTAKVQVSINDGLSWESVYEQAGTSPDRENIKAGETSFLLRTVSLAPYVGRQIKLRFNYDNGGIFYIPGTQDSIGWFIDEIAFTGLLDASDTVIKTVQAGQEEFDFNPTEGGDYMLSVRPIISGRLWHFSPPLSVAVTSTAPAILEIQNMDEIIVGGAFYHKLILNDEAAGTSLTFSAKNLPAGLKLNPATGEITGKPTKADSRLVTFTVKNSSGTGTVDLLLVVKPYPENLAGTYVGWVERHEQIFGAVGGRLDLKITALGSFTGSLTFGKVKTALKGSLEIQADGGSPPHAELTVQPPGKPAPAVVTLEFDVNTTNQVLTNAAVTQSASVAVVHGWRQKWNAKDQQAVPYFGLHTFGLRVPTIGGLVGDADVPQGCGYGFFTTAKDGKVNVAGVTADGQKITCGSFVGPQGQVLVYQALYATIIKGSLLGELYIDAGDVGNLANTEDNTVGGELTWTRPADPSLKVRVYKDGFGLPGTPVATFVNLEAVGARFLPPVGTDAVILGLTAGAANARVEFDFGGIESSSDNPDQGLSIGLKSKILPADPLANPAVTKLSANLKTGLLSGSFTLVDDDLRPGLTKPVKRAVKVQGMLIQDEGTHFGVGYFLLPELPTSEVPTNTRILSGKMTLRNNAP